MSDIDGLSLVLRWLHIVGAVLAVGGAVFARFVLLPAAGELPDAARRTLRDAVRRRYGRLFLIALLILLVTGFANYALYAMPRHHGQGAYHMVMAAKIVLAFGVFFIGSALTGRAPAFEGIRRHASRWLLLNILLGLGIIALAGVARLMPVVSG
ncbi:MAG: hypothetical protein ACE5F9_15230 [Phycisphaerae bacterium]